MWSAFDKYGTIVKLRIVKDLDGKSRGYAFIEYKHRDDALDAYWKANGTRVDDKKVLVDRESSWTDDKFRPWRLGEGYGKSFRHSDSEAKVVKDILKKFKETVKDTGKKRDIKYESKQDP